MKLTDDPEKGQSRRVMKCPCRRPSIQMSPIWHPLIQDLTAYDKNHVITYVRMLDADTEDADWRSVADRAAHRS